ncbi:hypothetical protein AOQ84DRAFT_287270 [Glonium stellatum]|uniref:Lipocalin-like domain-containing protein n=1 Tax=Glonium stellatum TaxID=574774 RepID=A0A8E2F7K5_9PEZI|nr:hypothetical protein AOQ84DRAFT_287270 [Glonium stellatum]
MAVAKPVSIDPDQIIGAWKSLTYDFYKDFKHLTQPVGPGPLERILFLHTDYRNCMCTRPQCIQPIKVAEWGHASDEDIVRVARGMTTYSGSYMFYDEKGQPMLRTDVDIALGPNWIGSVQIRTMKFCEENDRKYLTSKPM